MLLESIIVLPHTGSIHFFHIFTKIYGLYGITPKSQIKYFHLSMDLAFAREKKKQITSISVGLLTVYVVVGLFSREKECQLSAATVYGVHLDLV